MANAPETTKPHQSENHKSLAWEKTANTIVESLSFAAPAKLNIEQNA
jgi:hypothetical protein